MDFDIKMKLLLDTFELLRFRTSDRKKSLAIEKSEAQRRLYSNMGKTSRLLDDTSLILSNGTYRDIRTRQKKLVDVVCAHSALPGDWLSLFLEGKIVPSSTGNCSRNIREPSFGKFHTFVSGGG